MNLNLQNLTIDGVASTPEQIVDCLVTMALESEEVRDIITDAFDFILENEVELDELLQ